jgi:hypothetical protein
MPLPAIALVAPNKHKEHSTGVHINSLLLLLVIILGTLCLAAAAAAVVLQLASLLHIVHSTGVRAVSS